MSTLCERERASRLSLDGLDGLDDGGLLEDVEGLVEVVALVADVDDHVHGAREAADDRGLCERTNTAPPTASASICSCGKTCAGSPSLGPPSFADTASGTEGPC